MRTTFFHDTRFIYDGENYYTRGPLNQKKFNEYRKYFGDITVVSRRENAGEKNKKFIIKKNKIDKINFVTVDSKYRGILRIVKEQVKNIEFSIVRLPSIMGITALHYLRKYNKQYIVEMVGCPFDAFWNYGTIKGKLIAPIMYFITKYYVRNADNVLYVSGEFLQRRYPNNNYNIGCSDVNLEEISEKNLEKRIEKIENKKETDIIKIGLVGSLNVNYKGHEIAIRAISKLKDKYNVELHFLGAGDKERWEKLIKKCDVEDIIFFDGVLPSGEEVYKWMDKLDIYIIPSLQEGMPRALIEAMSRACPCIGTKVGGIPELLGEDMLIENKYDQLANKIKILIEDKKNMKDNAYNNFYKSLEFKKENLDEVKDRFYKEVLKNR